MKRWILVVILVLVLSVLAMAVVTWLASPLAGDFSPPEGALDVPVRSGIQILFNEPMRRETVERRLSIDPPRSGEFTWDGSLMTFTPDVPWPAGSQVQVYLEAGGRAQAGLGLPLLSSYRWSFTTAQTRLAYLWPSDAPADIYTLEPLSGEVRQLSDGANVLDYSLSLDGLSVFFSAANGQSGADLYQLDLLQAATASGAPAPARLLSACGHIACRSPQASPDGKWLAYERIDPSAESGSQVWLLNLADNQASPLGADGHLTETPRWSPAGYLVYYDQQQAAYIFIDLAGGWRFEAPNSTGKAGSWAPDSSAFLAPEIVYVGTQDVPVLGSSGLVRYVPFGPVTNLTSAENIEDSTPAYSPDGASIAFGRKYLDEARWSFGRQLWLMNADGTNQRQITQDGIYNHYDFAWSLDGQWLAYVRFDNASYTGLPELWLCQANGSQPIQLNYGGYSPQWLP